VRFLSESFVLEPGVRLRPVPEMGVCLAYTRRRPTLHRLNAASWLIVSLCDGRSTQELADAYRAALRGDAGGEEALSQGLEQLLDLGIVRRVSPQATEEGNSPHLAKEIAEP
jgi:hypothetical protein